jgi:predicted amidohydrolase
MKKMNVSLLLFITICHLYSGDLKVAAIQLEIHDYFYSSYERFQMEMEKEVSKAVDTFQPDLIIFPEYTSVFPAVTPYYNLLTGSNSVGDVFKIIRRSNVSINSIKDLFLDEAENVDRMLSFWGVLAEKYSVSIIGGTYFARQGDELRNRLIVYGKQGTRIYEQDKFFLTDFESDMVGLTSGSRDIPSGFYLKEKNIVLTICRDTFLKRWEPMYENADLWIDIKANGEEFTEDQGELFDRALPARMENSTVPYGATVCLTGDFLELFWEGESSFLMKTDHIVHKIITTGKVDSNEHLYFVIN